MLLDILGFFFVWGRAMGATDVSPIRAPGRAIFDTPGLLGLSLRDTASNARWSFNACISRTTLRLLI